MTNDQLQKAADINNEMLVIENGLREMDHADFVSFRNFHIHKQQHPELFMRLRVIATEYMREHLAKLKNDFANL